MFGVNWEKQTILLGLCASMGDDCIGFVSLQGLSQGSVHSRRCMNV